MFSACSYPCERPVTEQPIQLPAEPVAQPTKHTIPDDIAELTTSELCDRIGQIEVIPNRGLEVTDPIYESLLLRGNDAVPCLIEKIGNDTLIKDPRYSVPTWRSYAVGDTALFILLRILSKDDDKEWGKLLLASLPQKYREEWESNGIYAYFNYVLEPKNRKELQRWWKNWLSKNRK